MEDDIKQSTTSNKGGTGGSVAGLTATDLEQGFTDALTPTGMTSDTTFEESQGGFLGRPHGWDR